MRSQRIIEMTYSQPWLITAEGWQAINSLVEAHVLRERAERPKEDLFGDPVPQMTIERGVATIPIQGTIVRRASMLAKSCGAVDTMDISEELRKAVADSSVKTILLDVSSPGGSVPGVPELANEIASARKTKSVVAFTGDQMCSAAYWIAAGASQVVAAPSAQVGSIGVFVPWVDQSEAFKLRGLRVDLIKAGKYKAMGYPGTKLSDEQRAFVQAGVDATHDRFKSFVKANRRNAKAEAMEGQTMTGDAALAAGLVNTLVETLSEVFESLAS